MPRETIPIQPGDWETLNEYLTQFNTGGGGGSASTFSDYQLAGASSAGDTSITLSGNPSFPAGVGFVIIDVGTVNAETRRVTSIAGATVTLAQAAALTSTSISFDSATKTITGPASLISKFFPGATIKIAGSASNNGTFTVAEYATDGSVNTDGTKIVVNEALVTEAAGASVTITADLNRAHSSGAKVRWIPLGEMPFSYYGVKASASTADASNNRLGIQRAIDDGYWCGVNQFIIPNGAGRVYFDKTLFLERGQMLRGSHPNATLLASVASFNHVVTDKAVLWCRRDGFIGTLDNVGNERWYLRDFQLDCSATADANGIVWGPNQPDALDNVRIFMSASNATAWAMAVVGTQQLSLNRLMVTKFNKGVRLIGCQFIWINDLNLEQPQGTSPSGVSMEDFPGGTQQVARQINVRNVHFESSGGTACNYFDAQTLKGVVGLDLDGVYTTGRDGDAIIHVNASATVDSVYSLRNVEINTANAAKFIWDERKGLTLTQGDFAKLATIYDYLPAWTSDFGFLPAQYKAVSAAYSAKLADEVITADATSAAFSVTLPSAAGIKGRRFTVKRTNSGANNVTIATTSAQTIDGASSLQLTTQYDFATLLSDGSNWRIVGKYIAPLTGTAGGWPVNYTTASYYCAPASGRGPNADGALAATLNQVYYVPFPVGQAMTADRIAASVTTAAASAVVRLGIFADNDGVPGTLVLDAGTIDASTTGYKEIVISQPLSSGTLYWLGIALQGATGVSLRAAGIGDGSEYVGGLTLATDSRMANYIQASVTGAFPASATPTAGTTQSPLGKLRAT